MSTYENYDQTSRHYDRTRVPVGAEIILGCLARLDRPLGDLVVLDAGCGTGAYSQAIVDRVRRVEALDMSQGMLDAARSKLADAAAQGRIAFHRGSILAPPFDARAFDAAMINQVLHHLDDDESAGYPVHQQIVGEFARVLRPGGGLVINTCTPSQLCGAYWYYHLVPRAAEAMARRFVPLDVLRGLLEEMGFAYRGSFVPVDAVCQGQSYFDGRGPLSKPWRDGDSFWALATDDELADALAQVRELDANGELDAFVAAHDAQRSTSGQITFLFATRT